MNNNIPLVDIRAFVVIARCGSFTKAAEELGVSRAHLSRQLNQLETLLGLQLLVRTTRSQRLTDAGRLFFEKCQISLAGIDQAVFDIVDDNAKLAGPLAVNCVGGPIGEDILAPLIADFSTQYPDIDITLDFSSQRVDLVGDGFDLVVRMGALDDSRFIARKLMEMQVSTLAHPTYLKEVGHPSDPKALKGHNCLTGSVKRWSFVRPSGKGKPVDVTVSGNFTCKNGRALINAALKGNGVIRVPSFYCRNELDDGALVEVFDDWSVASTPIYLLYHRKKYQPQRLKVLVDYLSNQFADYAKNL